MASSCAQQATLGAIAPIESRLVDSGSAPCVGTRLAVGLKPTRPHSAAGMRSEPPVSEPRPASAMPSATDTAAPEDEPPGMRPVARSQGLSGVPKWGLMPRPENANSVMLVRPTITAPAAFKRCTATASAVADGWPCNATEPACVVSPATSNRSLTEIGRPSMLDRAWPAASNMSDTTANWRAASA
jgi:hypothetical protein